MNNVTLKGGLHVRSTANVGDSCTTEGMALWGQINGNPTWLQCQGGQYLPGNGMHYASEGAACTSERQHWPECGQRGFGVLQRQVGIAGTQRGFSQRLITRMARQSQPRLAVLA